MTTNPAPRAARVPPPVLRPAALAAWIGVGGILALALAQGSWATAAAAAGCLVLASGPWAYSLVTGLVFPRGVSTGILIFCAAALLLGEAAGFYVSVWWWDLALHLVSSAALALVGMALAMTAVESVPGRIAMRMLAILAFSFAMMAGAAWELLEFALDATLGTNTQRSGLPDTMGDIATNAVGAVAGAVGAHLRLTRGRPVPLADGLQRFMDLNADLYPATRRGRRPRR